MRRLFHEPLFHFLLLGAVLFGAYAVLNDGNDAAEAGVITITEADVDWLIAAWSRQWRRPPTETELRGLINDRVREEVLYREAVAMGLDPDSGGVRHPEATTSRVSLFRTGGGHAIEDCRKCGPHDSRSPCIQSNGRQRHGCVSPGVTKNTLISVFGEMTEWPIVRHWKCRVLGNRDRGFESPSLRSPARPRPRPRPRP